MISYNRRGIKMTQNQANYIANYNKENYKMYQFRIKKSEEELINKLDSLDNRNGFVVSAIKAKIDLSILTIKQIKQRIKPIMEKYQIKDVYLFGSYARGEANEDSDVDIYCDGGIIETLYDEVDFKEELEYELGKSVDIVFIGSKMDTFFKQQLDEDKIKLW